MPDSLLFNPSRALDANANISAGAKAYFYDSGTTALHTVYTDAGCTIPHPSPIVAAADGSFATAFSLAGPVKCVVQTSAGVTLYTVDPVARSSTGTSGASDISFSPTGALPQTDVQSAIVAAAASAASGFTPYGLGVTGSVTLLANLDATTTASGDYRFDTTTTGTFPTGVAAVDSGWLSLDRQSSGSASMELHHNTTDRVFMRRMTGSVWGTWRENILADQGAARGNLIRRGATSWDRLALGTTGQALMSDGTDAAWIDRLVLSTTLATTSGTTKDFTGIPSWVRRITIMLNGVSLSGTAFEMIQLGTGSTTWVAAGYTSYARDTNNNTGAPTTGFQIAVVGTGTAALTVTGALTLTHMGSNLWLISGTLVRQEAGNNPSILVGGTITLGAALSGVRLTSTNGTDTFDAGSVNVMWE